MQRILVSGIGRSGTTLVYQQIAKLLLLAGMRTNFRYEPYLWDIRTPSANGNAFGVEQISHYGLHVHTSAPLFLARPHTLHDGFLDTLFAQRFDGDPSAAPDACLTKVIRASGRLRAYLDRFPDLRVVACLRNPYDTINSSLGMFSFFGEEFHKCDRLRFKAELANRGEPVDHLDVDLNSIEWTTAWLTSFTAETLSVARDYPGRVHLFCYEKYQDQPGEMLDALQDFIGVRNEGIHLGLSAPAGPSIKTTSLTMHDIDSIRPAFEIYRSNVLAPSLGSEKADAIESRLVRRYAEGNFSFPVAGADAGRKSTIQLRAMLLHGHSTPFLKLAKAERSPLQLRALVEKHAGSTDPFEIRLPERDAESLKQGRTFGVVITNHNNGGMVLDAVLSCLNQTLPFDQIVVVDDRSTDGSLELLEALARQYSPVEVIALKSNVGPSAARHIGIRALTTDFCTQLDGDDLFWPTKNAEEVRAIAGNLDRVAFSDILFVISRDKTVVHDTSAYHAPSPQVSVFAAMIARRPQVPRDLTFARARYFEAGGYDLAADFYEDWDFKLRLAALAELEWHRSASLAGTVYNRLDPGLSRRHPADHARALITIFGKALRHADLPVEEIMPAFEAALGAYSDRGQSNAARMWLTGLVSSGNFDNAAIADFFGSRALHSLDNRAFRFLLADLAARAAPPPRSLGDWRASPAAPASNAPIDWRVHTGFTRFVNDLPRPDGISPVALTGRDAYLEVNLGEPSPAFAVHADFAGHCDVGRRVSVAVAGQRFDCTVAPPKPGNRTCFIVPIRLERGRSLIHFRSISESAGDPAPMLLHGLETAEHP